MNTLIGLKPEIFEDKESTVLLLCGTFNPFHKGHLDPFNIYIKDHPDENIAACLLIPSSDTRASTKLKGKHFRLNDRYNIIKKSIENLPLMTVCRVESDQYHEEIYHPYHGILQVKQYLDKFPVAKIVLFQELIVSGT